ncbi:MAG: hypothetical protein AAF716_10330 [Cyanobacteria bacterium P01_D01_bin.1]
MKRHDTANPVVGSTIGPLTGQLIKPVVDIEVEAHKKGKRSERAPCYRLEKLISREVGKRTFLATDIYTDAQVVIKLLLYCPDPQENEIETAIAQRKGSGLKPYELSTMLPYLTSFEVETTIGIGLALVKPYVHQSPDRQPNRQPDRQPDRQSGLQTPSVRRSVIYQRDSTKVQHIVATPTPQQIGIQGSAESQRAYADFRVKFSPDRLSIRFLESRVCEGISDGAEDSAEGWLLAVLGTVIFVGGTVAITGSIALGIAIAALLPIVYRQIFTPKHASTIAQKQAIIRLSRESKGHTFLSLTTALMSKQGRAGNTTVSPIESKLHYSRLSVKTVTVAPTFFLDSWKIFGAKLTFTFYNHDAPSSRLCVAGTYQEIRWIQRHLLQWAKSDSSSR